MVSPGIFAITAVCKFVTVKLSILYYFIKMWLIDIKDIFVLVFHYQLYTPPSGIPLLFHVGLVSNNLVML